MTEGEGGVEVCAILNSTYDVECALPRDFHINLHVLNGTAGNRKFWITWSCEYIELLSRIIYLIIRLFALC